MAHKSTWLVREKLVLVLMEEGRDAYPHQEIFETHAQLVQWLRDEEKQWQHAALAKISVAYIPLPTGQMGLRPGDEEYQQDLQEVSWCDEEMWQVLQDLRVSEEWLDRLREGEVAAAAEQWWTAVV